MRVIARVLAVEEEVNNQGSKVGWCLNFEARTQSRPGYKDLSSTVAMWEWRGPRGQESRVLKLYCF